MCSKFYFNYEITIEKTSGKEKLRNAQTSNTGLIKELMDYAKFLEASLEEKDLEQDLKRDFDQLKVPAKYTEAVEEPKIVEIRLKDEKAICPTKKSRGSAGNDLASIEEKVIPVRGKELVRLGYVLIYQLIHMVELHQGLDYH